MRKALVIYSTLVWNLYYGLPIAYNQRKNTRRFLRSLSWISYRQLSHIWFSFFWIVLNQNRLMMMIGQMMKQLVVGFLTLRLALAASTDGATVLVDSITPLVVGQTFLAGSVDPTLDSNGWSLTSHGVAEKLFTVDQSGEIIGQVAESVEKISSFVWDVTLKTEYKFSDGTPVTAQHVADALEELNTVNPSALASLGEFNTTVMDDSTVRITSEIETHVMSAVLAEWVFAMYLKKDDGSFVFTGPYVIENFGEDQIDLIPNAYYPDHEARIKITLKKFADGAALAEGVKNKEVDIAFHLPIDSLEELRKVGVYIRSFEVGYHYMMFHNTETLTDVNVRKAIDLAIDRSALSQALKGGTATRSLFPDNSPYFLDETDQQFGDAEAAEALLETAGWTLNSNGKRVNSAGDLLSVHLVAYPHRPDLGTMQPIIAASLEDIGFTVETTLTGDDWDETQTIIDDRSFDLLLWAQHTLPAGDPLWFLSSFFGTEGGNNHARIQSETVDALLAALAVAEDHDVRVASTFSTHSEILTEVPVSNLLTPYWHVGLSERVKDYEPWGSDYYVIRADLRVSMEVPTKPDTPSDAGNRPVLLDYGKAMMASIIVSSLFILM